MSLISALSAEPVVQWKKVFDGNEDAEMRREQSSGPVVDHAAKTCLMASFGRRSLEDGQSLKMSGVIRIMDIEDRVGSGQWRFGLFDSSVEHSGVYAAIGTNGRKGGIYQQENALGLDHPFTSQVQPNLRVGMVSSGPELSGNCRLFFAMEVKRVGETLRVKVSVKDEKTGEFLSTGTGEYMPRSFNFGMVGVLHGSSFGAMTASYFDINVVSDGTLSSDPGARPVVEKERQVDAAILGVAGISLMLRDE
ncbi:hypothetical protein [Rubritalea tangerina]|uniref:hypothetical protein n=1 Tax=Rubritalea tangerina TaxID=430798 RepID=UPI00360645F5